MALPVQGLRGHGRGGQSKSCLAQDLLRLPQAQAGSDEPARLQQNWVLCDQEPQPQAGEIVGGMRSRLRGAQWRRIGDSCGGGACSGACGASASQRGLSGACAGSGDECARVGCGFPHRGAPWASLAQGRGPRKEVHEARAALSACEGSRRLCCSSDDGHGLGPSVGYPCGDRQGDAARRMCQGWSLLTRPFQRLQRSLLQSRQS